MNINRKTLVISLLVLLTMCVCVDIHSVTAQTNAGQSTLNTTRFVIDQAFNGVLAAEKAGANVTELLSKLTSATDYLTRAESAYRNGNLTLVESNADAAVKIARRVTSDAQIAKEEAQNTVNNNFWLTIVLTIVGIIVLVLILFIVWRFIKRSYIKDPIESKPQVIIDET